MAASKPTDFPKAPPPDTITYAWAGGWGHKHSVRNKLHTESDFLVYVCWGVSTFEGVEGYGKTFPIFKRLTCGKVIKPCSVSEKEL